MRELISASRMSCIVVALAVTLADSPTFGNVNDNHSASVSMIISILKGKDERAVEKCVTITENQKIHEHACVEVSKALLGVQDGLFQMNALAYLSKLGQDARGASPNLLNYARKCEDIYLARTLSIIVNLTPDRTDFLKLCDWLAMHKESKKREAAAHFLGNFGNSEKATIVRLKLLCDDPSSSVRVSAARSLSLLLNNKEHHYVIIKSLDLKESRAVALRAVVELDIRQKEMLPILTGLLELDISDEVIHVFRMLERMQPESEVAIPLIAKYLEVQDTTIRSSALSTLVAFRKAAVKPVLFYLENCRNEEGVVGAIMVIYNIGAPAGEAVPLLMKLTKDNRNRVRMAASSALKAVR